MNQPASDVASGCAWCGLPLPKSWWKANDTQSEYCCFGCRFAAQVTADKSEAGHVRWTLTRLGLAMFFAMNVSMFTMALWSYDVYEVGQTDRLVATLTDLLIWLAFMCSLPVGLLLGIPIAVSAWMALASGRITTDLLVVVGVGAAYGYSMVSVFSGSGPIYFEVASLVLVLVTLGRWIEARGKLHSNEVIETLEKLIPETSRRLHDGVSEEVVATIDLQPGDVIRVLPGERLPTDGVVLNQTAAIDEQLLTGESRPLAKHPGDEVSSGTLNLDADLLIRVTRSIHEGAVARLMDVMRQARQSQGYYQRLADRVTTWFVPFVGVVCAVTVSTWLFSGEVAEAILSGLAVVLIACPCALGLATSLAVWTALGHAAEKHVLIRNGEVLERLGRLRAIRFDKTGTLTTGQAQVAGFVVASDVNEADVWAVACALAGKSSHGYSQAILAGRRDEQEPPVSESSITDIRSFAGRGMSGQWHSETVYLGSREWLREQGCQASEEFEAVLRGTLTDSNGLVCIGWGQRLRGAFVLSETERPEARDMLASCRTMLLDLAVLSGDRPERAAQFARTAEVDVKGGLRPEQKLEELLRVRREVGPVMMVGDGINDAPALAAADVGVALGCGTDVSRDAAGVCLLSNDLSAISWVIQLGQRTRAIIWQNLAWAFGYNTIGMTLAAFGLLNPVIAAILMFVSSVMVLANSHRLSSAAERTTR